MSKIASIEKGAAFDLVHPGPDGLGHHGGEADLTEKFHWALADGVRECA